MKRLVLIAISAFVVFPVPVLALWGPTERESEICRGRAARERNEFSAKQTYKICLKNIRAELKENERRSLIRQKEQKKKEQERQKEQKKKEQERLALAEDISRRCENNRSEMIAIDKEMKKYRHKYDAQSDEFFAEMAQKYGPRRLSIAWDYPVDDQAKYEWVRWFVLKSQRKIEILEEIVPDNDSRFHTTYRTFFLLYDIYDCNPTQMLVFVK